MKWKINLLTKLPFLEAPKYNFDLLEKKLQTASLKIPTKLSFFKKATV